METYKKIQLQLVEDYQNLIIYGLHKERESNVLRVGDTGDNA